MKFSDLVDIKVAIILYKAFHGILPYSIQSLFKLNVNNTRQYNKFVVKYTRTSLKAKCISSYGVRYWNKLSSEITNKPCLNMFKNQLKKSILVMY